MSDRKESIVTSMKTIFNDTVPEEYRKYVLAGSSVFVTLAVLLTLKRLRNGKISLPEAELTPILERAVSIMSSNQMDEEASVAILHDYEETVSKLSNYKNYSYNCKMLLAQFILEVSKTHPNRVTSRIFRCIYNVLVTESLNDKNGICAYFRVEIAHCLQDFKAILESYKNLKRSPAAGNIDYIGIQYVQACILGQWGDVLSFGDLLNEEEWMEDFHDRAVENNMEDYGVMWRIAQIEREQYGNTYPFKELKNAKYKIIRHENKCSSIECSSKSTEKVFSDLYGDGNEANIIKPTNASIECKGACARMTSLNDDDSLLFTGTMDSKHMIFIRYTIDTKEQTRVSEQINMELVKTNGNKTYWEGLHYMAQQSTRDLSFDDDNNEQKPQGSGSSSPVGEYSNMNGVEIGEQGEQVYSDGNGEEEDMGADIRLTFAIKMELIKE